MHEAGIAESVIKRALDVAKDNNALSVKAIGLRVGTLSGVEPGSLKFALDCVKADTPASGAEIDIEIVTASGVCNECGKISEPDTFLSVCGHCGAKVLEIISGKEFEISYIDIDDVQN